jgi:hypothetical protein
MPNPRNARWGGGLAFADLIERLEQSCARSAESRLFAADLCVQAQSCIDRVRVARERERHLRTLAMALGLERRSAARRLRDEASDPSTDR